jgi:arsenate reductase-like glutaredoxin family protein
MDKNKKIKNSFSNATKKQISQNKLMNLLKILPDTLDNVLKVNKKLTYKNKKKQTSILNRDN